MNDVGIHVRQAGVMGMPSIVSTLTCGWKPGYILRHSRKEDLSAVHVQAHGVAKFVRILADMSRIRNEQEDIDTHRPLDLQ